MLSYMYTNRQEGETPLHTHTHTYRERERDQAKRVKVHLFCLPYV